MKKLTLLLLLITTPVSARLSAEIDGDECKFVSIRYQDTYNVIVAQGNCQSLYDECTKDFCKVKKIDTTDIIFGKVIGAEQISTE